MKTFLLTLSLLSLMLIFGCDDTVLSSGTSNSNKVFQKYYFENMHISFETAQSFGADGTFDVYWSQYGWNELQVTTTGDVTSYFLINGDKGYSWTEGESNCIEVQSPIAPYYYSTKPSTATLEKNAYDALLDLGYSSAGDTTILGVQCEKVSGVLGEQWLWRRGMYSLYTNTLEMTKQTAILIDSTTAQATSLFDIPDSLAIDQPVMKHKTIESLHYLSIGASDTKAYGASHDSLGYITLIKKELSEFVVNLQTTNEGVSGQTIDYINQSQKDDAVRAQPDLITIWTGGNDFRDIMDGDMSVITFSDELDTLLATLTRNLPDVNIVIGNLPDMTKLPTFTEYYSGREAEGRTKLIALNDAIAKKAMYYGASLVVMNRSNFAGNPHNISDDGFHPSDVGYALMAEYYMEAIDRFYPYEMIVTQQ